MASTDWVSGSIEKRIGFALESFRKDPANAKTLLRKLGPRKGSKVTVTPVVVQRDNPSNHFEFFNFYENNKKIALEQYAFYSVCEKPVEDVKDIVNLIKTYDDCTTDEERLLWLRVASPVVDSARMLSSWGISNTIRNDYLQRHRLKIIRMADERKITYHKRSLYCDNAQSMPSIGARVSHPEVQLAVILTLGSV